jgi:hypothetical protein
MSLIFSGMSCAKCGKAYYTSFNLSGKTVHQTFSNKERKNIYNIYRTRQCIYCLTNSDNVEIALSRIMLIIKNGFDKKAFIYRRKKEN